MKTVIIFSLCVVAALCAPTEDMPFEFSHKRDELGQYTLKYSTQDGTVVIERGTLVSTPDGNDKVLVYEGEYRFVGGDGKEYITKYKSDLEGGYQPEGDHLPKSVEPLPVPDVPVVEAPQE